MMFDSALSPATQMILNRAFKKAQEKRHEFLTIEHITLELLEHTEIQEIFSKHFPEINLNQLMQKISHFIENSIPRLPKQHDFQNTRPTLSVQRILKRAIAHAASQNIIVVTPIELLNAILKEQVNKSVDLLKEAGFSQHHLNQYLQQRFMFQQHPTQVAVGLAPSSPPIAEEETSGLLTNLNLKAAQGQIQAIIGREEEILQLIQILSRKQKNNALLLGDPGVGKTALIEGLAKSIVEGRVPMILRQHTVYTLNLGALLAGTRYRGDFEQRLQTLLAKLRQNPKTILFIDEIHTIIGAGAVASGSLDLANLLKPVLTSGEIKCIGATTYPEYHRSFEKDHAMARRFQTVDVPETTPQQTLQILHGIKKRFEDHYQASYTDDALQSAIDLSTRYIRNRSLPDKAIDVIDEAGALYMLLPLSSRGSQIDHKIIEKTVSKIARLPEIELAQSPPEKLKNLEQNLKNVIFGQDQAIIALVDAMKLVSSGLRQEESPLGSFLFRGPTGVGKTELAKQLAHFMGIHLSRFDMSEYKESHTIARLIGAPPGYVGHDTGGLLTEEVSQHPYCVLLLDEIEKAHPDIYNVLLQIMDYGTLTDSRGRQINFRQVMIIMTTNAGGEMMSRPGIGFAAVDPTEAGLKEIQHTFSPEFRNRLDAIITFKPLTPKMMIKVCDKLLRTLADQLHQKNVTLNVNEQACLWFSERGYDQKRGARPLARLIQEQLKKPLAEELLFGQLRQGGVVEVTVEGDQLRIQIPSSRV